MLITSRSVEGSTNITALSAGKSFHDGFLKGNKVSAKSKKNCLHYIWQLLLLLCICINLLHIWKNNHTMMKLCN